MQHTYDQQLNKALREIAGGFALAFLTAVIVLIA